MIRAVVVFVSFLVSTLLFGGWVIVAALFRRRDGIRSPYARAPRYWGKMILWFSGVRIVEHDPERKRGAQHVFVANHLGHHDVFALAAKLRWIKFVAKAELFRIPVLGRAMLAAGMVPI